MVGGVLIPGGVTKMAQRMSFSTSMLLRYLFFMNTSVENAASKRYVYENLTITRKASRLTFWYIAKYLNQNYSKESLLKSSFAEELHFISRNSPWMSTGTSSTTVNKGFLISILNFLFQYRKISTQFISEHLKISLN